MIHSITMQILHTNLTKPTKHFLGGKTKRQFARPRNRTKLTYAGGGTTQFAYDQAGNMLSGDGRTMTYNEFNKPLTITKSGVTSTFDYGADRLRYRQVKTGLSGGTQKTYYVGRQMEIEEQGTRTTYRHYLDGVAVLNKTVDSSGTTWVLGFNLKDRLGGVVTLADHDGIVLEHRSYDPFGKPRKGDFSDASVGTIQAAIAEDPHPEYSLDPLTDRGFTDHEHLDEQSIIHMNGRVYSYDIGRFTSVDPFISDPTSSQSLNPYSYIVNNPLAGIDPSGYIPEYMKPPEPERSAGCLGFHCDAPIRMGGKSRGRSRSSGVATGADGSGNGQNGSKTQNNGSENIVKAEDGSIVSGDPAFGFGSDREEGNAELNRRYEQSVSRHGEESGAFIVEKDLYLHYSISGPSGFADTVRRDLSALRREDTGLAMLKGIAESGHSVRIFATWEPHATSRGDDLEWETTTIGVFPRDVLRSPFNYVTRSGGRVRPVIKTVYSLAHELVHAWQNTVHKGSPVPEMNRNVPWSSLRPFEIEAVRYTNLIRLEMGESTIRVNYTIGLNETLDKFVD